LRRDPRDGFVCPGVGASEIFRRGLIGKSVASRQEHFAGNL
jgi:hypothetical protein